MQHNQNKNIKTPHGEIVLPAFMPDATYGSIRNISFADLSNTGIKEIVTTTLHIEQKLGSVYVAEFGGIHKFFGWDGPILTDSGGWQVFSLINSNRKNPKNKITELGCSFIDPISGNYTLLTPESSMAIQANLGGDIQTVLDDPVLPNATYADRFDSVRINTLWAKRSKDAFSKYNSEKNKPLLGAVIQGADDKELRRISATELIDIGFDLYNFGGIPMMSEITWKEESPEGFHRELLKFVIDLLPKDKVAYAMGVGQPDDIAYCIDIGWDLFDTVLPTRNARHGYLYVSSGFGDVDKTYVPENNGILKNKYSIDTNLNYSVLHAKNERYKFDNGPVDPLCSCECCKSVSRAYLRHLIKINEPAGFRLATIHNLAFYANWMNQFRVKI